ncbi:hypothetical protein M0R88_05235 [Halorussus gelatinilyticus]|uniref:Uncharacterized protein n=1 Tax=Halorussus gelatinilyticus TaxID=2937524 RepID=A0A8U0INC3_9EURY|nr:hypothetical protein [Halorussus gelatinilyticus]UPW01509.1 hypothetical protein M0R88_05235 [Halorussus gelatinilyticus]
MPLPTSSLAVGFETLSLAAVAVLVPLVLASLVYADARRRRSVAHSRGASLAPLAWGATTFFSGVGCVVVAACYLLVQSR